MDDHERFQMFRRAKLMLNRIDRELVTAAHNSSARWRGSCTGSLTSRRIPGGGAVATPSDIECCRTGVSGHRISGTSERVSA